MARTRERVGYIGVGLMGHGAAKHILEKGNDLSVLGHRNRERSQLLTFQPETGSLSLNNPADTVACGE